MSVPSLQPVAFWGLQVPANDDPVPFESEVLGGCHIRITMAAIDPTQTPLDKDKPIRTTLKLVRRRLMLDDYDDEDDDDDDDENIDSSEDEETTTEIASKIQKLSDKLVQKEVLAATKKDKKSAMDINKDEDEDDKLELEEFVICTLDPEKHCQQTLDITIGEDEEAFFKVVGNYSVSLTGNYLVRADQSPDMDDYSDDDDSDYDLSPDEDELMKSLGVATDSDDGLDDLEDPRLVEIDSSDEKDAKKSEKTKIGAKGEKSTTAVTPTKQPLKRSAEDDDKKTEPKMSKKQLKKLKANDGKAINTPDRSSVSPDTKKKVQFALQLEQGPSSSKDSKTTSDNPATTTVPSSTKKVVQGVIIDDKKIGKGLAAKNGHKLSMRYIGKLPDGKVFDSNTKGKPFNFKLGKGEVIKGWDIGLSGMQVGGERRITIPPAMGYGKKGTAGIPGNSTLIFDVKLMEVK